jgi:hypothetical protein
MRRFLRLLTSLLWLRSPELRLPTTLWSNLRLSQRVGSVAAAREYQKRSENTNPTKPKRKESYERQIRLAALSRRRSG